MVSMLYNGTLIKLTGICLDVITGAMPPYPVREVSKDVIADYESKGGKKYELPKVPLLVGGDTDGLVGMQYNFAQPRLVHILTTGLAIYRSVFVGIDGTRGCIGGPHKLFEACERQFLERSNIAQFRAFLAQQVQLFNHGIRVCLDSDAFTLVKHDITTNPSQALCINPINSVESKHYNDTKEQNSPQILVIEPEVNTGSNEDKMESYTCSECGVMYPKVTVVDMDDPIQKPLVLLSKVTKFMEGENAGSNIDYRCIRCRNCGDCRNGESIEKISLKAEAEQHLIENTVEINLEKQEAIAYLPFIADPEEKLCSDENTALKIYQHQVRMLDKNPDIKLAVIESEAKLQNDGFVDWLENLPDDIQNMIMEGKRYFIPWRFVQNPNSVTTPTRLVFDGTCPTANGCALNDLVAKGIKSLNSMLDIYLRFRCHEVALHTDAKKLYNHIKLQVSHWRFQLYYWQRNLVLKIPPKVKAIKTTIYGIKSSGNQAECALRKLADLLKDRYPEAAIAIKEDTYMDDTVTGAESSSKADELASDISDLLARGGFSPKGFTISGRPPLSTLSQDGVRVGILGSKWSPEKDEIQLAMGVLNFGKKYRGKKSENEDSSQVPKKLTKRICAGKVGEVFDLTGLSCPVTGGFKIDLHNLHLSYGWDDMISETDRQIWINNFESMNELGQLTWVRSVIPDDFVSKDAELIGTGDASESLACAACYIRFRCVDGSYSCRLMLAKTKIIGEDTTLPRAELLASTLNTHVTEVVKRALKRMNITKVIYVLDSEIALHWIASTTKPLKPWVRNRVIEISRFTEVDQWFHIESELNPSDVGTRKGAKISDIAQGSDWINGMSWMQLPIEELKGSVLKDVNDIKLKTEQLAELRKEQIKTGTDLCNSDFDLVVNGVDNGTVSSSVQVTLPNSHAYVVSSEEAEDLPSIIAERLKFSHYLIDPNRHRWAEVVRIIALVIKMAKVWMSVISRKIKRFSDDTPDHTTLDHNIDISPDGSMSLWYSSVLTDNDTGHSLNYFFRKGTEEVKTYVHPKHYENISMERNGVLYYIGRVFNGDISFEGKDITQKMIDLASGTFVVPIVDRYSPLAYSIVNDVHWHHMSAKHSGIETTIRAIMMIAHILNIRQLVKLVKKNCKRCRYLLKRTVDIMMAPASKLQLCVAPPFYVTQCDLCGSFPAYSTHNKRCTIKVWIVAFVCCVTGMTSLKIMQGYDTVQFVLAFTRFGNDLGYPKKLLIDEGSQLVCGCENVTLNMRDIKGRLNRKKAIEFDTCPVGGHNYHGKVERKIHTVREVLAKSVHNARLSVMEWATLCSEISNTINDLPVAIGNETEGLENLDLITPNRLRIGRNNDRSPVGPLELTGKIERILQLKIDVFQSWWEAWLVSALPKLVPQPKWFKNDEHVKCGDIILFNKDEGSAISGEYRYGIIEECHTGNDGKIRTVTVRYRNASEEIHRTTKRAVRSLVIIHRIDEIDLMEELGKAAISVDAYYLRTKDGTS